MQYVALTMATAQTNVDVVALRQPTKVGVITVSTVHTQPVLFWAAQSVSKPRDYWGGWAYQTMKLTCSTLKVCVIVAYMVS
jgi:hypothetical protein